MAVGQMNHLFRKLRRDDIDTLGDGPLLDRFLARREEAAFETLVRRHGPMVLGACRRLLGDGPDAEDAFQATFLVLVRKAATIRPRDMVGNWLYGVACRTARHARAQAARRRAREREMIDVPTDPPMDAWPELRPLVDHELERLPDRYRAAVVLCDLEGRSRAEAARQLGVPEGTLSSRLARGRRLLADRLTRRGVTLSAGAVAAALAPGAVRAAVPGPLLAATVKAGLLVAGGETAALAAPASVAALADGVLKAMLASRLKAAAVLVLLAAGIAAGVGAFARPSSAVAPSDEVKPVGQEPARRPKPPAAKPEKPASEKPSARVDKKKDEGLSKMIGPVVAVSGDGRRFTVEFPLLKGERSPTQRVEVTLTDKSAVTYFNVPPDGARPTVGYHAEITYVEKGGETVAVAASFVGLKGAKQPDLAGQVVTVAEGGKRFTILIPSMQKGVEDQRIEFRLPGANAVTYFNVPPGGATPTKGYTARVWLAGKDAAAVQFSADKKDFPLRKADRAGRLVAVSPDSKRLTLEAPSKMKGEPGRRVEVELTEQTRITFTGVGPGGAKPTPGQAVQAWLADGNTRIASRVSLSRQREDRAADLIGTVAAVSDDGKRITLDVPPRNKGEQAKRVEVAVTGLSHVVYNGVGPHGARPSVGYQAQVWLSEEGQGAAAEIHLDGAAREKQLKKPDGKPTKELPQEPHPARDPLAVAAVIDREIIARLSAARVKPSPPADDAEFLRRVYLDLAGRIPTADQAAAFLDSTDPDRRRKLIDELLAAPDFGRHLAAVWRDLLAPASQAGVKPQPDRFSPWLAEQFNRNRGWDRIVTDLLIVEGEVNRNPQSAFLMANTEEFQPRPNLLAASTARLFLGVRLQCAECHDHPFAPLKQADFWGVAAFFGKVRNTGVKGRPFTLTEGPTADPPPDPPGAIVLPASAGKAAGRTVKAKFLGGAEPALDPAQPLRPSLAGWLTSPDNPYFARAFVNRTWAQLFSRGLVHPPDDMHTGRLPSHPQLLKLLAGEFTASKCDIKHLVRCICNSRAYQRTSRPLPENESDRELCSRMAVKPIRPEALYDSLAQVLGESKLAPPPQGGGGKGPPLSPREEFVRFFRAQGDAAEEGELGHGIPQFLRRLNGPAFNGGAPLIDRLVASGAGRTQVVESLFLATLSRRPTPEELRLMEKYLDKRKDAVQGYASVLWVLLNSGEFVLNH